MPKQKGGQVVPVRVKRAFAGVASRGNGVARLQHTPGAVLAPPCLVW